MPDILISENIIGAEMDALRQQFDCVFAPELWKEPDRLRARIHEFRALIVRNQTQAPRELVAAGTRLEIIGRAGVGLDNVDLEAASDHGVVVAFAPEQTTNSVAELAIGMIIALARMIPAADRDTRLGHWNRQRFTGIEILGKTLGVVGLGRIGFSTAAKARALGMDIIAYDPFVDSDSLNVMQLRARLCELDELLSQSDFVTCHLPLTKETKNLFSYERFCQMKPGAYFINTARGSVVDEAGLISALREQRIAGAALDVRDREPPEASPLIEMDNVILMPHVAAFTREAQTRVVATVCRDVTAVLTGKPARNFANFSRPKK
jgi:D-3-phosphoglycerate dehydrogenase